MSAPDPTPAPVPPVPAPPGRCRRLLLRISLLLLAGMAVVLGAGFVLFVASIERRESDLDRSADGIVVLTGGAERIVDAARLLTAGHGRRLLITGVHPDTTLAEIGRGVPIENARLQCCVDVGRSALNTRGNAIETAQWARQRQFRSLIIVTSAWHMPRALVELARAAPEVELQPYPVITDRMRDSPWWTSGATLRLLVLEYAKYLLACAQIRLWPATAPENELSGR